MCPPTPLTATAAGPDSRVCVCVGGRAQIRPPASREAEEAREYVLRPINATARLRLDPSKRPTPSSPQVTMTLELDELGLILESTQYSDLFKVLAALQLAANAQRVRRAPARRVGTVCDAHAVRVRTAVGGRAESMARTRLAPVPAPPACAKHQGRNASARDVVVCRCVGLGHASIGARMGTHANDPQRWNGLMRPRVVRRRALPAPAPASEMRGGRVPRSTPALDVVVLEQTAR